MEKARTAGNLSFKLTYSSRLDSAKRWLCPVYPKFIDSAMVPDGRIQLSWGLWGSVARCQVVSGRTGELKPDFLINCTIFLEKALDTRQGCGILLV